MGETAKKPEEDGDKIQRSRDAYDEAQKKLVDLKAMFETMEFFMADAEGEEMRHPYEAIWIWINSVEDNLQRISDTLEDICVDHGDFLYRLKANRERVSSGVLGLHGNLETLKLSIAEAEHFLNNDLPEIIAINQWMVKTAKEISRKLLNGKDTVNEKAA